MVLRGSAQYVGLVTTHVQHVMEAIANNLYRIPGLWWPTPKSEREARKAGLNIPQGERLKDKFQLVSMR